jgi:RNA recognition motif-containing protein
LPNGIYMKILVRNLDRLTTEEELKTLFQEFGAVQSCSLVMDRDSGTSKGFGFIDMPKSGEAKAAIKKLNNKTVGNNKIRVKKAEDKTA